MNITRTATRIPRVAASACVLGLMTISLAACGGSEGDGEYIYADQNTYDEIPVIKVDGDTVTFTRQRCTDNTMQVDEEDNSVGALDDERTTVVWNEPGNYHGTDPVKFTDGAIAVGTPGDEKVYIDLDSDAGQAHVEKAKEACTE